MGIFNDYTREGKGVKSGPDDRLRIIVFFDIYFRKFWNLILINLLYIVFCIPVITIGPATAGITKILRNYAREEHAFIWLDFWDTFKKNFLKAFIIGLIDVVFGSVIVFDIMMYSSAETGSIIRIISLAVLMLSATIFLFMNYYIFTMLITFKLTVLQILKNAFIFAWIGFWRNILITIIIAALTMFVIMYSDLLGVIFLTFLYFSTVGLVINFITYPLIKKHMIDGYDSQTGKKL